MQPINQLRHLFDQESPVGMDGVACKDTYPVFWYPFFHIRQHLSEYGLS